MEMNIATSGSIIDDASATISIQVESAELLCFKNVPDWFYASNTSNLRWTKNLTFDRGPIGPSPTGVEADIHRV